MADQPGNQEWARMRKEVRALRQEVESLRAENQQYQYQETQRTTQNVFQELGLNPAQAELFMATAEDTEVTKENVAAWAIRFGIAEVKEPEEDKDEPDLSILGSAFRPISVGAVGGGTTVSRKMTRDEWVELQKKDMNAAIAAFENHEVTGLEESDAL